MTRPELELRWAGGSLNLMGRNDSPFGEYEIATHADGTDWGNFETVRRVLRSAMLDGSRSARDRDSNRKVTLSLEVTSPSHAATSAGEQALDLVDGRRCELVWTPPRRLGIASSVFIVDYADLKHVMDDEGYERGEVFYTMTLDCLPHVRSNDYVEIDALPAEATTLINSLAGDEVSWTGDNVEFTLDGDMTALTDYPPFPGGSEPVEYVVEADFGTPTLGPPYFYVLGQQVPTNVRELASDVRLPFLTKEPYGVGNDWIYFFEVPAGVSINRLRFTSTADSTAGYLLFSVHEMGQSNAPTVSAGRQSLRLFDVPGSRRASAEIAVSARDTGSSIGGTALGDVLIYTGPDYDPRLTLNETDGRSPDVVSVNDTLSGGYDVVTSAGRSYFRAAPSFPQGSYALWARMRLASGAPATLDTTVDIDLVHSSDPSVKVADVDVKHTPVDLTTTYGLRALARVELPGMALSAAAGYLLRFNVTTSADTRLDELLAFNLTDGSLTIVETGQSTFRTLSAGVWTTRSGASRVSVEPANLDHDVRIRLTRGSLSDAQVPSLSTQIRSWPGAHALAPGKAHLYIGTTAYAGPATTARFRPAWNTHPPL